MKKRIAVLLIAAAVAGSSVFAAAAPSISQIVPEAPQVIEGNLSANQQLVVQNANTGAYTNKEVASVVEKVNDENTKTNMNQILTELKVDTAQKIESNTKKPVNPTLYETITPFVDLAIKENDTITYTSEGKIEASMTIEAAKGKKKKDLLILQLDPETGAVHFVAVDKLDRKTGEITATFPTLGPIALLEKSPIVVKGVSPEKYEDKKVATAVEKFKDQKAGMNLKEVLSELQDTVEEEIQLEDGKTIRLDSYKSTMGFSDLAIAMGEDYQYNMEGEFEAKVNKSIEDVDWQSMVSAAFADFDVETAQEEPESLVDLGEFTVEGSLVMQMNPITGVTEYIEEPSFAFEFAGQEEEEEPETEETLEEETEEEDDDLLMQWVASEENENAEELNLVINGTFKSMGPFAVFLPEAE